MRFRTVMIFSLFAGSLSAQTVTIDFENIPIGTPAESIAIPGVHFVCNNVFDPGQCPSAFTVQDLATFAGDLPPGVTLKQASGRALVLRQSVAQTGPPFRNWRLDIDVNSPFASISSVLGGYGCWGGTDVVSPKPCGSQFDFSNNTDQAASPYESEFTYVSSKPDFFYQTDYGWNGGSGYQLRPGSNDWKTYFIDNIIITPYVGPDNCRFGGPVRLHPPYEWTTAEPLPPPVKAGETVHVAWEPITFAPGSTERAINVWKGINGNNVPQLHVMTRDERAMTADLLPEKTERGDRVEYYFIKPYQRCGSDSPTLTGVVRLRVLDPPEPLRIDSVSPSVALPGSTVTIFGKGFVGTPAMPASTPPASAEVTTLDFVPPGDITVRIGGLPAKLTVVNTGTLSVVVPQLLNGSADIVIKTVYGEARQGAAGFIVGKPQPRRRATRP